MLSTAEGNLAREALGISRQACTLLDEMLSQHNLLLVRKETTHSILSEEAACVAIVKSAAAFDELCQQMAAIMDTSVTQRYGCTAVLHRLSFALMKMNVIVAASIIDLHASTVRSTSFDSRYIADASIELRELL